MASHVSTCMEGVSSINRSIRRRRRGEEERKREREEMRERERRKERRKERKKREKEKKERKMKEAGGFFLSSLAFQRSELIGVRSNVRRFDEGLHFKRSEFFLLWFTSSLWAIVLG